MDPAPASCDRSVWGPIYVQLVRGWMESGEPAWMPLAGESMAPFLHGGSKVLVGQAAASEIMSGDLVVYEAEERLICHRVIRRRVCRGGYAFLTKGDNWRATGAWIRDRRIIGKVIAVERNGSLRRLDTPVRSLHALGIAALSSMAAGWVTVERWAKQMLRNQWRWTRSSWPG